MPILNEEELRTRLSEGAISAFTVDASIFDEKQLQFSSATLQALARLNGRGFLFMLANTVRKEVVAHLEEAASQSFRSTRKVIGQALRVFETKVPTREQLLEKITGGRSSEQVAQEHFGQYVKDSGCEILNDTELVDTATLFLITYQAHPVSQSARIVPSSLKIGSRRWHAIGFSFRRATA